MKKKFYCHSCQKVFESEFRLVEYVSSLYGPCSSLRAGCPDCKEECGEYVEPKKTKSGQTDAPACAYQSCCSGCN